jgi:Family of unknown function (DUF5391)
MNSSKQRKNVLIVTLTSCLLFCSMIVVISLSPLSEMGENANKFNSVGMWSSIGFIFWSYIIPLVLYLLRMEFIKYIMAVFCFLGLVTSISIVAIIFAIDDLRSVIYTDFTLMIVVLCCSLLFITNIIWLSVAFSPSVKGKAQSI